jgi:signal transduction histidine kinase
MTVSTHVLVVDDDRAVRLHISRQLQRYHYQTTEAANGREAIELLHIGSFDLVLLDVVMPVLDGYQVLTQLKADPILCTIPVIMISAVDDLDRAIRCIEQGAEDYLSKPLNPILLKARISASLERKRLRDQEQAYLQQLKAEKMAVETAHRAKSAFLANMSHELRTPLNAIIGYSEMLQEDMQAEGAIPYLTDLQKIHTAGKHLLHLIDSILALAKIEAGKMELHLEQIAVSALIEQIVTEMQPIITAKGNRLQVSSPIPPISLSVDVSKIRQILFNLLSNANKFTEAGTIGLTVEKVGQAEIAAPKNSNWIAFRISDTGIGMSPSQIEQMFQAFTQADDSTTRRHDGAGLGLSIARRFCQLMHGDISVESKLDQGSVFTVWLPVD